MRLNQGCIQTLTYPDYWKEISDPDLESFLDHRKKSTPILEKDREHSRYKTELEKILVHYDLGTRVYDKAKKALNKMELEMISENVNRFWEMNEERKNMVLKESGSDEGLVGTSQSSQSKPIAPSRSGKSREVYEPELAAPSVTIKKKDEPIENNSLTEELVVDYDIHPNLKAYCEILKTLQNHHVEEDSQSARRFIKMLKWFCVDYELFLTTGWTGWEERLQQNSFPTPQISLRLVSALFLNHTNDKLHSVVPILKTLITKGKIFNSDVNYLSFETIRMFFGKSKKKCNEIDTLTVASVISAVVLYVPTPCRGLGSEPSENHVKAELWAKIISNTFTLYNSKFVPVWEFHHLFPGHGKCGSSRSDFIAIVFNQTNIQFPFFLIEIEQNGFEVHKDEIVAVSEAAHEFNRILSLGGYQSDDEVNQTRFHIGLINGTSIQFSTLEPLYDKQSSKLVYIHTRNTFSLNIKTNSLEVDVESVLKLVSYLREVVCRDGAWIENMINRPATKFSIKLKAALPSLPTKAVQSRPFETKFTPISKRVKYDFLDEDDE
ncbi:hypothetical protein F8M41_013920 [Gigaspora margarita]|uniref:Uncharacterized protein n=2 Tax=Gigaspora margarita TaxID=4874 RepID=A0A8H4ARU5_GIGMA|nr:hypothetical protein F8M41_013920 [Gigaspora margarita]